MNQTLEDEKEQVNTLLKEAYAGRGHDLKQSIELATKALDISSHLGDMSLVGKSLNQLSLYCMIMGEYDQAIEKANEAILCFEKLDDEKGIADAKYNIAGTLYKTDNYHLGLIYLSDCLTIYKKFDDFHNISRVEKTLGTIYDFFGDQNNSVRSYENAIEAAKKAGDLNLESNAYNNLSGVYLKQGKIDKALELAESSIAMKRQTGDTRGLAFALYARGKVFSRTEKYRAAEKDFIAAIAIHEEMGERLGLGMTYNKLGKLYLKRGLLREAKEIVKEGIALSSKYNIVIIRFKCEHLLYQIYRLEDNKAMALESLESYLIQRDAVINAQTLRVIENYELITKMKDLEKEAQVQKEKAEIIEKKNRAEESVRVRQEFLSTMSHEIRTPLNAITSIISLMDYAYDEEGKKFYESLKFASNNLLRIINDILDFSKLDSGKDSLEMHPTKIKILLKNIFNTYESQAKEKGLRFSFKLDSAIAETYDIDETKITQMLGNLISNAVKFTEKGSVEVEIEMKESEGDYDLISFKIHDTGEGIAENLQDDIFNSFAQIKPITTRKQGGTGLGLAIVKKLVELHGGTIGVKSEVQKGSTFYFELKLKKAFLVDKVNGQISNNLKGKTVLLAEDNDLNAMVVRKLLSQWGIQSELVINGNLAIEKAQQKVFDFILMDIHMPEMNGFDAAAYIRSHDNPNIKTPIYALTADITAKDQKAYFSLFNGFLWKPLQIEKLYEALSTVPI